MRKPKPDWLKIFLQGFGATLRDLRREKHLFAEHLGARAEIAGSRIGEIERGEVDFSISRLVALAHALDVPWSRLLRRVELQVEGTELRDHQRERCLRAIRRLSAADLELVDAFLDRLLRGTDR